MKNKAITHILVPLDFSENSLNALDTAIVIAKLHNATITLLNVVDPSFMFGFNGVYYISESIIDSIVDVSARRLGPIANKVKEEHELNCAFEIKVGLVPQSISKTAYDIDADLIIMGTHGTSGFREFFIGSSAQKVVKITSCPVLTIPSIRKCVEFKKILFPIRPIAGAVEKYDFLRNIITNTYASINLLILAHTYNDEEKRLLRNLVIKLKAKTVKDRIKISGTLKIGEKMPQTVLKMSKHIDPDLIILTSSHDRDLKQFFIGPFEQHIVNHATVPVLSIKPKLASPDLSVVIQHMHESFPTQIPLLV